MCICNYIRNIYYGAAVSESVSLFFPADRWPFKSATHHHYQQYGSIAQQGRALNQIDIWRGHQFKSDWSHHKSGGLDIPPTLPSFLYSS